MNEPHKIRSLSELPQDIAPPRDLWPQIRSQIEPQAPAAKRSMLPSRGYWFGLAATVAALAVGIWLGRGMVPATAPQTTPGSQGDLVRAAYVTDPRYVSDRAELIKSLEARLNALPEDSRAKVLASLEAIRQSMHDIEQALGRDPSNALLQELLLNTRQDEMRVLTAMQEASDAGGEI